MVDMITPNFSKSEMACRCGCGIYEMDDEFMRMLQELRNEMNGPLRVTSARRCDRHNDAVSTAKNQKNGVHTLGQASDILISERGRCFCLKKPDRSASVGSVFRNVEITPNDSSTWTLNLAKHYGVTEL